MLPSSTSPPRPGPIVQEAQPGNDHEREIIHENIQEITNTRYHEHCNPEVGSSWPALSPCQDDFKPTNENRPMLQYSIAKLKLLSPGAMNFPNMLKVMNAKLGGRANTRQ